MWGLLPRKNQIIIIVALTIIFMWGVEGATELLAGKSASPLKYISLIASGISIIAASVVNASWRWIWRRLPFLGRRVFPDLTGIWEGHLESTWIDPATGQPEPAIPITIWVRQGIFATSIKLRTGESTSYSTRCLLEADHEAGRFRFWYSYDNTPSAQFRYRSAKHEGVAWLEVDMDADPGCMVGCYYTDRKTTGDILITRTRDTVDGN
jgi:SMODS-associating 2TM, beta-strand rich effector domain